MSDRVAGIQSDGLAKLALRATPNPSRRRYVTNAREVLASARFGSSLNAFFAAALAFGIASTGGHATERITQVEVRIGQTRIARARRWDRVRAPARSVASPDSGDFSVRCSQKNRPRTQSSCTRPGSTDCTLDSVRGVAVGDPGPNFSRDCARHLAMQRQHVLQVAFVAMRPEMPVGVGLDQLHGDADLLRRSVSPSPRR